MTSIDQLSIRGIRNFSHRDDVVIRFFHPFTVILGANGCGKTTIIECLKMVATGTAPPDSSKGRFFIHDPKIDRVPVIKAQIKLKFRGPRGRDMLTQKGNKAPQYKALDQTLQTVDENGNKHSISHRCQDMDKLIPTLMGVSKAVIENVIFCHQEESNWPLMEPSSVKKRFDEIFAASRYTKALEIIRKNRQELTSRAKEVKHEMEIMSRDLERAWQLKEEIREKQDHHDKIQGEIEEMSQEIEHLQEKYSELEQVKACCEDLLHRIKLTEHLLSEKRNQVQNAEMQLEMEFDETDDQLEQLAEKFETDLELLEKQREERAEEFESIEERFTKLQTQKDAITEKRASFRIAFENYKQSIEQRDSILEDCARKYEIQVEIEGEITSSSARLALQKLEQIRRDIAGSLNAVKVREREDIDRYESLVEEQQMKLVRLQEQLRSSNQETKRIKERLHSQKNELRTVGTQEATLAQLKRARKDLQSATEIMELKKSEYDVRSITESIEDIRAQREAINKEIMELDARIRSLNVNKDSFSRIKHSKHELREKEFSLERQIDENSRQLQKLVGRSVSKRNLESLAEQSLQFAHQEKVDLAKQLRGCEEDFTRREAQLLSAQERLDQFVVDAKKLRNALENVVDFNHFDLTQDILQGPFPRLLAEIERQVEEKRTELTKVQCAEDFLQKYLRRGARESLCPLCDRCMDDQEKDHYKSNITSKIAKLPQLLESKQESYNNASQVLDGLKSQQQDWHELNRLETVAIPRIQQEITELKKECGTLDDQMNHYRSLFEKAENNLAELNKLHMNVQQTLVLAQEVQRLKQNFENESDLEQGNMEDETEVDKLDYQKSVLMENKDSMSAKLEELYNLRDVGREEVEITTQAVVAAQSRVSEFESRTQLSEDLKNSISKLESSLEELELHSREIEGRLPEAQSQLENTKLQQRKHRESNALESSNLANQLQEIEKEVKELKSLDQLIRDFEGCGTHETAEKLEAKYNAVIEEIKVLEIRKRELRDLIKENDEVLSQKHHLQRGIDQNRAYRKLRQEVIQLEESLQEYKNEWTKITGRTEIVNEEMPEISARLNKLQQQCERWKGQQAEIQSRIEACKLELHMDRFDDIEEKHRQSMIAYETTLIAQKDLDKYHKALDAALMRYHTLKIQEINQIIRDLWRRCYTGNDIDMIEIRSDVEGEEPSGRALRNYNYRVVMIREGTELDMRGRCSAGQKVLASLVIRLALAETFSLSCGILALDEPTTNLDRDNINMFANALSQIINTRRSQKSFQIIVITHDEEFVQELSRCQLAGSSRPDYYYRVYRDDRSSSKIMAQPWA